MTTVDKGCRKKDPPTIEAMEISDEMPERCPDGLVCYTEEEHGKVERRLVHSKKMDRWASITRKHCKLSTGSEGETP